MIASIRTSIFSLGLLFLFSFCAEERKIESQQSALDTEASLQDVEIEESYDTTTMATMYMKVVGKENMLQAEYVEGMSNQNIVEMSKFENLVNVDVAGSPNADDSDDGYVVDESGTVKTKVEIYDLLQYDMIDVQQPFRVSVKTKITDFKSWKRAFDEEELNRNNAGMRVLQLGIDRSVSDQVFLLIAIEDISKAREMMEHPGLKKKMEEAGVLGDIEVKFWRPAGPQTEEY